MNVRLSRQFCRHASHFLITSAITLAVLCSSSALADDIECGGQATQRETQTSFDSAAVDAMDSQYEEEWCGWATHDSCAFFDSKNAVPYPRIATRTSSAFDESIAAAAATACATAGISVEQIVEPFAMVGTQMSDSMKRVEAFQEWWQGVMAEAEKAQQATEQPISEPSISKGSTKAVDAWSEFGGSIMVRVVNAPPVVEEQIARLALEEPVDVDPWGVSVLVKDDNELYPPLPDPPSIPDASVAQVGASPVIVSFDDSYWPYDLSARDLRVWSVFPLVTEPFCVRSRHDCGPTAGSWADLDQATTERIIELSTRGPIETAPSADRPADVVHHAPLIEQSVQTAVATDQPAQLVHEVPLIQGSAECLLDEFAWQVRCALDEHQDWKVWLRPRGIGRQLAAIAIRASRAAETATERIAGMWPDSPPVVEAKPVTAGEQLLARAGAIEAAEPVAQSNDAGPAASIADAETKTVR